MPPGPRAPSQAGKRLVVALGAVRPHIGSMSNDNPNYPYTLEIAPCVKPSGHYGWAIRRHGKLLERSDRPYHSETSARERGEAALERQIRAARVR